MKKNIPRKCSPKRCWPANKISRHSFPQCVLIEGYIVFLEDWNRTTLFWFLHHFLLSPFKPLKFGVGISRLKKDPIRSEKANLYQDSWIVGATAGWVKWIRCRPEISWKSANSSLFLSVQQKLSWTASTAIKTQLVFERGNWQWILTTCPYCPCFWRLVKIACWFNQVVSCIFV